MSSCDLQVEQQFIELIESYNQFRPILMTLQEKSGGELIPAILNELRALNDHIARCYIPGKAVQMQKDELTRAEGHLRRAIYDTFKHLNIIYHDYIGRYEKKYFGNHWYNIDGGKFWAQYASYRKEIDSIVSLAKKAESENDQDATPLMYRKAYVTQSKIYDLIATCGPEIELSWCDKVEHWLRSHKAWILWTAFGAIVSALTCKALEI